MTTPATETKLFCITGVDKPDHLERRLENRPAHLAHWGALGENLILGGPLLDEAGNPCGSMLVVRADSLADVEAYAARDPYQVNGVFGTLSVRRWTWLVNKPATL